MQSDSWDRNTVEERRSERVGSVPRQGEGDEAAVRHGEDDGRGKQEEAEDLAKQRATQNPCSRREARRREG